MAAEATVTNIITDQRTAIASAIALAQANLNTLGNTSFSVPSTSNNMGIPMIGSFTPSGVSLPSDPTVSTAPTILPITIPASPTAPSITYPSDPTILDIDLPDVPEIDIPSLDVAAPEYNITAPASFDFTIDAFNEDTIVGVTRDRLVSNIRYGGTGLSESVENAIWQRDKERNEQQLEDSTDKVVTMWAKKGFSLPDGMLAHSLSEVQKEYMNKMLDRTREVAIKQAELEQKNIFQSMDTGTRLVDVVYRTFMQYNELMLKVQESMARFANEYIDLQIKTYGIAVEGYKAAATVYAEKIRANLSRVEIYKAQLEGELAKGQINEQNIKVYAEKLKAIMTMVDVYKAEIAAMTGLLDAEKTKIDANKLQFDAWAKNAEVAISVYNGKIQIYKAASDVEVSQAEMLNRQSDAQARISVSSMEVEQRYAESNTRSIIAQQSALMEAARGIAQATSQWAAGATAALSAGASISYSE